jgi:hypothetical protein
MKKFILMLACVVAVGSATCETADAEAYVHDGFFLRIAPGLGWNDTSSDSGGNTQELSGVCGLFNLAIGGAVAQDLIVHLDLSGVNIPDPDFSINGHDQSSYYSSASTSLIGIGMTYYFPSNFYVTGVVGIAESSKEFNGTTIRSDTGFGANVMAGKEWWISANWGIGIAGQFLYTNCPERPVAGARPDEESTSFGILFSATYN